MQKGKKKSINIVFYILIYSNFQAVWTQIVLLSLGWTFAIMSLILVGSIVKYVYALINCLQVNKTTRSIKKYSGSIKKDPKLLLK